MLVQLCNDKTSFAERPLDWRASTHIVLGQLMRRIYEKRFCSSPVLGSRTGLSEYSHGNRQDWKGLLDDFQLKDWWSLKVA
jgi:hypothetical protein